MPEPYDAFISYARADAEQVRRLTENLHNAGLHVFLDEWEIGPGDVIVHHLDAAILNSRNGVLCVTPTALSRPWVQEEYAALLNRAVEKKLRLIPVLFADAELPAFLATRLWVDLRTADGPEYEKKVRELIAALKGERLGAPPRRDGEILPKPGTAFRAEGVHRGRLRIGSSAVAYIDKDGATVAEHPPKGLSDRTKFSLWNLDRARHGHLPEDAQLHRDAAAAGTAAPPSALHALLLEIGDALTREVLDGAAGEALRQRVQEAERLGFPLELGLEIEDALADHPWETLRLPAVDALSRDDQLRAYAEVGGHPRALEYLDALLRGGQARFHDISRRLQRALEKKRIDNPQAWLRDVKGDLDRALAETVTLAVDDVLLGGFWIE